MLTIIVLGAITALVIAGLTLEAYEPAEPPNSYLFVLFLDIALGMVAIAIYPLRHRAPLLVVSTIVIISAVSNLAAFACLFAIVSLATRRKPRELFVVAVLLYVAIFINDRFIPSPEAPVIWWEILLIALVGTGVLYLIGMYIGGRRALLAALQQQVLSARGEQVALMDSAAATERTRIAREMHDVLAHRLSLVALHSGVLEYRSDLSPEETHSTAGIIRENTQRALVELREVLGVLRDQSADGNRADAAPQPTLASLDALFEDSRAAGQSATLMVNDVVKSQLHLVSDSTSRHAFRVIQESLTNARKHAPGQKVNVLVAGAPGDVLTLTATNRIPESTVGAPPTRHGMGLMGLHERVRLAGGHLWEGDDGSHHFVVKAELPWTL